MEITKREIIASIIIIAIMLLLGFIISDNISSAQDEKNAEYQKAIQIDSTELFEYGMNTNVGNAFVCGKLSAVDTVTFPEISGDYLYIEKVEEHYNRHTRTVTDEDGNTTTEVYYTWDYYDSWQKHSNKIEFCGVQFDYGKIDRPSSYYLDTIKESYKIRYKYYVTDKEYQGTIYTLLQNGTISDRSNFYVNYSIKDTLDMCTSNFEIGLFWIFWIMLSAVIVFGFYQLENWWLE